MTAQNNKEQIEYWNGQAGQTWVAAQERMDVLLSPLSRQALDKADAQPGERAIDVGCGCGDTTLALAERGAAVWGVDISEPMLARAKQRASGIEHVKFSRTDAATQSYTADHQLLFSRFGVMFFADPMSAFSNLRTALAEDGRMCFMCWQAPVVNPWVSVAGRAIQPYLPDLRPADPKEPGPFAFADEDYLRDILSQAGFADVRLDHATADLHLGDDLDMAVRFQGEIGPIARILAELDGAEKEQALTAVREALADHLSADGLDLGAATWLVSATND